ncbi:hypothetical protein [Chitinophaga pinensis]|uniref:Uncharacterized protein n=1 Tax=Chitinophaga pinensis (strain ATCC 43595 / DSM 2588 / LMG 13176 / NBRC 15968 / NCIMB 11800 / UQM 2034) TaxID=485918 RepID=A0A979GB54_CHIPD|nr:hypothetical protein [Chitinophaga pinensis]ACU64118.1 hypothetical protein Cpin_6717 [Chitinophaga pinensis DSM 2588]
MTKFFKRASIAVFVFIGLPIIIGITLSIRKAVKNVPSSAITQVDSIKMKQDSIQAAAAEERKHPRTWYYQAIEDPMTSDTTFYATISPKQNISVRTDREIIHVSVVQSYDNNSANRANRAYDDGYRNGYNNAQRKTNSFWGKRNSSSPPSSGFWGRRSSYSSSGTPQKRTVTTTSTNYTPAYLTFTLKKKGENETDAYIDIADGAFNPGYFTGEQGLHIRFDKNKDAFYPSLGYKDESARILHLATTKGFLEKLKKAKTMLIEVDIVNTGRFVLEFDVHDLKWKQS